MAQTAGRAERVADRIKVVVAQTLDRGVKDPRLGFVTVTDVKVTGDLQHASIFYTVLGTDEERADTEAALRSATGMIRTEIGRNIKLRLTPSIEFILDAIPENAAHIEALLQTAHERDDAARKASEGSSFAGEADPYRKPGEESEDESAGQA
ncbi:MULTISPECIES: 30S ribosome-binding factor RbfA [unclassified Pseudoclavibacter]|uniref:30S ribosome-binding factor RbfA n=1 Tax=unclassified Pseudoclavibacter TaxID=2615177 RepID=UPI001300F314|nr:MULTISPECIES: 30S ribosome-binding factor RbfA [unclassified Pseudoclavibacter]KAB1643725.1 30S ribosome-binding factor RbfA [Pseudoclavibacter sp. CFCC 14310]KAB1658738.1 30S ribosome-binding factor RbfA [Pseudoclavibacter sp. CFCC 11306]KAB1661201.1 30S ribosome-binding factor RbfA [Pseudoclavibacter sp. CFCC 13796]KAB1664290.1 30S ribosome-binding factor RbfA [Pseudoclavibacter sp. CFCC 13611]